MYILIKSQDFLDTKILLPFFKKKKNAKTIHIREIERDKSSNLKNTKPTMINYF